MRKRGVCRRCRICAEKSGRGGRNGGGNGVRRGKREVESTGRWESDAREKDSVPIDRGAKKAAR